MWCTIEILGRNQKSTPAKRLGTLYMTITQKKTPVFARKIAKKYLFSPRTMTEGNHLSASPYIHSRQCTLTNEMSA